MAVHIFLIGVHRIHQFCRLEIERVDDQTGLLHMDIVRITVDEQLQGRLRLTGVSVLPVAIHLLQYLQMRLDRVAMSHAGVDIHVEEVLQHGRLGTHHGILVGPHLVLLLRLLIIIDTEEHDDQGDDKAHDDRRPQDLMPRLLLGFLRFGNLRYLRHQGIRLGCHVLLSDRHTGRGIDTAMTVRALRVVLEDILPAVRATGDLSCYLNPT